MTVLAILFVLGFALVEYSKLSGERWARKMVQNAIDEAAKRFRK